MQTAVLDPLFLPRQSLSTNSKRWRYKFFQAQHLRFQRRNKRMASTSSMPLHVLLFPFMSKGHTIPLLDLARLLLLRRCSTTTVTIFTTRANRSFISASLSDTTVTIIDLPFPQSIEAGIPARVESTDKLPSMSLFIPFVTSTKLMQPDFEAALDKLHPRVDFMITDGFLSWTADSAAKFNIPRLVSYGMSNFAWAVFQAVGESRLLQETESDDELFAVPHFPWLKVTRNDFGEPFTDREPKGPHYDMIMEQVAANARSYGFIMNSFYELETAYVDFLNRDSKSKPKSFCVGPLCLAQPPKTKHEIYEKPPWILWLDEKLEQGSPVLYVAFGSQADIAQEQFKEMEIGLEKSEVNFLWVVRKMENQLSDGYEERVKGRGMVVREWVDQREILGHEAVKGFLSHCGWNSVLESICAKVPILAWPMMAEQHINVRMVVEEIKIGIRTNTCDECVRGIVKWQWLEKTVRELMEGEKGKDARKKVKDIGEAAIRAVEEGGSSWCTLNELISSMSCRRDNLN